MRELDILNQLERVKGLTAKTSVLSKNVSFKEFNDLVTYSLSFSKKFYIKKFKMPEPSEQAMECGHDKFIDLLNVLNSRSLTGNRALDAVEGFLGMCNEKQQKWYSRVLKKDLRCGISVKTANKAGFSIPVFDVMLATDGNKCKKLNEVLPQGVFISPKLDGYRCIAIKSGDDVSLYSRNGTYYDNFPSIVEELRTIPGDFVLDGEIMSDDFQSMQKSAFANRRGTTVGDVKFYVFGFIPVDEWESSNFAIPTEARIALLKQFLSQNRKKCLVEVEHTKVHSIEEIMDLESSFINQGYEGAMALPDMPYYKGRKSNALMKFKRTESMDVKVVGMYEGTGKNEGRLGGISVIQDNGEVCDVGTGFTDADREWIWANKDKVMDRIAEIQYQEMTNDNIMRFPIFLRWRDLGAGTGKI